MADIIHPRSKSQNTGILKSKSGWLLKQTDSLVKVYKKKFIVLENKHLYIYIPLMVMQDQCLNKEKRLRKT